LASPTDEGQTREHENKFHFKKALFAKKPPASPKVGSEDSRSRMPSNRGSGFGAKKGKLAALMRVDGKKGRERCFREMDTDEGGAVEAKMKWGGWGERQSQRVTCILSKELTIDES